MHRDSVQLLREVEWEQEREQELARKYFDWLEAEKQRELRRRLMTFISWLGLFAFVLGMAEALRLILKN
jgi:hypothetical protein